MIVRIEGIIEHGKHLGRTIGFPTANVRMEDSNIQLPADGVYAAALWLENDVQAYPCMLNQGLHPTVPHGKPTIEANILGFAGDIYGCRVKVEYLKFIRGEKRFENLNILREQLFLDQEKTREWILKNATDYFWHEEYLKKK